MWKYLVPSIVLGSAAVLGVGCDPDLNVVTRPGDGGTEGGAGPGTSSPTGDAATSGNDLDGGPDSGKPGQGPDSSSPVATHKVDGVNDFTPGEKFATSSMTGDPYEGFIAWDLQRLYFGMSGPDVDSKKNDRWVMVYLGVPGATSTRTGINYGGQQQPTLPFDATHHLRWKASGDYASVEIVEGGVWKSGNPALVPLVIGQQGKFLELSITRAALGATGKVSVHMNMLVEGNDSDWTFAAVPSTSFSDGKNPAFTKYFEFDLTDAAKAPNTYAPK
jgi:hypothetical protein